MLAKTIYSTFDGEKGLSGLCLEMLSEQKETWPGLRKGYELLESVRERNVQCKGFVVRLQYNPGRMKSTSADMSDRKDRRCFLCLDRLPEGQKGILYRGEYLILCNPMPVFPSHFTISHVEHRIQSIGKNIDAFLRIMNDFGPGWTLLYNGPKCGASAPDHLHFQAVPSGRMPVEKAILEGGRIGSVKNIRGTLLYRVKDLGREAVVLEGDDPTDVEKAFHAFMNGLKKALFTDGEPMMNVIGAHEESKWRLTSFPRRKHRPDAFFREGEKRVVVSPGAIDMGGVLITPVEKDFERLGAATIEEIYREVSMEEENVDRALQAIE